MRAGAGFRSQHLADGPAGAGFAAADPSYRTGGARFPPGTLLQPLYAPALPAADPSSRPGKAPAFGAEPCSRRDFRPETTKSTPRITNRAQRGVIMLSSTVGSYGAGRLLGPWRPLTGGTIGLRLLLPERPGSSAVGSAPALGAGGRGFKSRLPDKVSRKWWQRDFETLDLSLYVTAMSKLRVAGSRETPIRIAFSIYIGPRR